ncbi:MAG TPA: hypothetical protein VKF63_04410 [Terracidiphilus sp.]|nr:hypothetical protein [Terracidiphilus sp.]
MTHLIAVLARMQQQSDAASRDFLLIPAERYKGGEAQGVFFFAGWDWFALNGRQGIEF